MSSAAPPEGDTYVMGRTPAEYERLRHQAQALEPLTRSVLDQVGLSDGMSCLDAGCGPGEVMRLMAERVGPSGRIVGVDMDGDLGREAISHLAARGHTQCEFIQGDVTSLDPSIGQFDLVFARLVLIHVNEPVTALRNLYSIVKPGGRIVAQDYLFIGSESHPRFAAAEEFLTLFNAICEKTGRDLRTGVKLPAYFIEAGIGAPDGTEAGTRFLPHRETGPMMAAVFRSIEPLAVKLGLITQERAAGILAGLEHGATKDGYSLWPLLLSAWKTKPA